MFRSSSLTPSSTFERSIISCCFFTIPDNSSVISHNRDIISSGVIGEVTAVTANLNYAISEVERIRKPELAGGALLDVGVYTINFASMVLGDKLKDVQATAIFREGVDMLDTIAMVFEGDRMAVSYTHLTLPTT